MEIHQYVQLVLNHTLPLILLQLHAIKQPQQQQQETISLKHQYVGPDVIIVMIKTSTNVLNVMKGTIIKISTVENVCQAV
jgi:hypothetical protein